METTYLLGTDNPVRENTHTEVTGTNQNAVNRNQRQRSIKVPHITFCRHEILLRFSRQI